MPTYDYQCRDCGRITEVIHSMLDDGPTTCDACGGPLRRVIYPSGIIFKGSGFYATDSRKAKADAGEKAGAASAKPSSDGTGASSAAGASDTTPAAGAGSPEKG